MTVTISTKKTPPDGGYGWVIVGAYAIHHLLVIPILQGFGLIYKDKFKELNFTATEVGLILNTGGAFSMFCGIISGPLLKHFGFRKVAYLAAFSVTLGILLTSNANSFVHFMITYGFVTSLGIGLGLSAYPLALNSYFTKGRSKASGYTLTIAGLGPVFMPQIISFLLDYYGVTGAMFIIGAIVAHSFVSASLLQPVERHMKDVLELETNEENNQKTQLEIPEESRFDVGTPRRKISRQISREVEIEAMYNLDSTFSQSIMSIAETFQREIPTKSQLADVKIKLFDVDGEMLEEIEPFHSHVSLEENREKKKSLFKKICERIVDTFDLTLLKDPIYLNIMIGMSLAIFAEMNFSILTPFIVGDYDFSNQEIATFMSVLSCTDICFRFLAPYVGDCLNQSHRVQYLLSLLLLILTRFSLLITSNYYPLLLVAAGIGIARGFRTVYSQLVLPSYVPIERLASAIGIQMAVNGIFVWVGGPIIGFVRDLTGSYVKCILVLNTVTFTAFLMWSAEMIYMRRKK